MTSTAGSTGSPSVAWAFMGPWAFALGLFSLLGAVAHRASRLERCDLNLPWSPGASEAWLASVFPTAWRDTQRFRQLSSECVAQLHADVSVAALLIWLIAVLVTIWAFSKARFHLGRNLNLTKISPFAMASILVMGFLISLWAVLYYFSIEVLINFTNEFRRNTPRFDGHHASMFFYCVNNFSLYIRAWFLIVCVFAGVGLCRRTLLGRG